MKECRVTNSPVHNAMGVIGGRWYVRAEKMAIEDANATGNAVFATSGGAEAWLSIQKMTAPAGNIWIAAGNSSTNYVSVLQYEGASCSNNVGTSALVIQGDVGGSSIAYLPADTTSGTTVFANIPFFNQVSVVLGHKYNFKLELFLADSVTADGAKIDFAGGLATATNFRVHAEATSDLDGIIAMGAATSTTLAGVVNIAAMASVNQHRLIVEGTIEPSVTGSFIPRFAQNAHSTGTLTVFRGSNLSIRETP